MEDARLHCAERKPRDLRNLLIAMVPVEPENQDLPMMGGERPAGPARPPAAARLRWLRRGATDRAEAASAPRRGSQPAEPHPLLQRQPICDCGEIGPQRSRSGDAQPNPGPEQTSPARNLALRLLSRSSMQPSGAAVESTARRAFSTPSGFPPWHGPGHPIPPLFRQIHAPTPLPDLSDVIRTAPHPVKTLTLVARNECAQVVPVPSK